MAACGGDGDGDGTAAVPVNTDISVTVLDGPIAGALVCQDLNNDGNCTDNEPHNTTNGSGVAVVTVATVDKDKFPMVAVVSATTSTDTVNGGITTGFVMTTPAGKPGLISPLSTLVQNVVAQTGKTVDAAEAQVKLQTGIASSLFASFDITKDPKPADGSVKPAALARMLVLTTQEQARLVAAANAVNSKLPDNTTITQPMLDAVVQKRVQELLSAIVQALPNAAAEASLQTAANAWTAAQNTPAADGSSQFATVHRALNGGSAPYSWGAWTGTGQRF